MARSTCRFLAYDALRIRRDQRYERSGRPIASWCISYCRAGIGVGWINALIINRLRIPPIIATLAVGYILVIATLIYNRGFTTYAVSPLLAYIASGRVMGTPIILLLAIALTAIASWFMHKTVYGRELSAVGQNSRAAHFAGSKSLTDHAHSLLIERPACCPWGSVAFWTSEWSIPGNGHSVSASVCRCCRGRGIVHRRGMGSPLGTLLGSIFLAMIVTTMAVLRVPGGSRHDPRYSHHSGPRGRCGSQSRTHANVC